MCRTWPRLVKNVAELKNAVCDLVWTVQDPEGREDLKHLAERARDGMKGNYKEDGQGWRGTINGLLDGWFCGVSVREIDWEVRGCAHMPQAWLPRQTRRVHPRWYGWDAESGLFGMRSPGSDALADFAADKFLVAINNVSFGHPCGGALLRSLAWYWCAANFSADWLLSFAQIFGQPIRWGNYDNSDPALRDIMADMLENMGSAAWAAAPNGCTLELKEPSNKGSDNPQRQLIDLADTACDLLILGQILTGTPGDAGIGDVLRVHAGIPGALADSRRVPPRPAVFQASAHLVLDLGGHAGNGGGCGAGRAHAFRASFPFSRIIQRAPVREGRRWTHPIISRVSSSASTWEASNPASLTSVLSLYSPDGMLPWVARYSSISCLTFCASVMPS